MALRKERKAFEMPTKEAIAAAVGDLSGLPKMLQLAFSPESKSFAPLPRPRASDWLANHEEKGQSLASFQRVAMKATPHATYRTIYLQPLGDFDFKRCPSLAAVRKFALAFFHSCDVQVLPGISIESVEGTLKQRVNPMSERRQFETRPLLELLSATKKARDARKELMSVVVTTEDLYPRDDWNFVYGLANMSEAVGVWSFARLDPAWPGGTDLEPSASEKQLILRRSIRILIHELTHLFGLKHCIFFTCLMNGANHEQEMDRQPLHLCPVCLRKLHDAIKFDVADRYRAIRDVSKELGFEEEARFYADLLAEIGAPPDRDAEHKHAVTVGLQEAKEREGEATGPSASGPAEGGAARGTAKAKPVQEAKAKTKKKR